MVRVERHYTNADDWVILNKKITHTACRVYMLAKGRTKHETMAFPEHGFRATAEWFVRIMDGMFSAKTVREALRNLVENGALRRLNENPKDGGGGEYEFVVDPGKEYEGFLSVFDKEKSTKMPQNASFREVDLSGHPSATGERFKGKSKAEHGAARSGPKRPTSARPASPPAGADLEPPFPGEPEADEAEGPEVPEFDMTLVEPHMKDESEAPSTAVGELAEALEQVTSGLTESKLRLLPGQCARVAEAYGSALAKGWEPRMLAKRLAGLLNTHIRMPEQFLVSKADDLGDPPKARAAGTALPKAVDGIGEGSAPKIQTYGTIPRREGRKVISAEEQERVRQMQQEYAEKNRRKTRNP